MSPVLDLGWCQLWGVFFSPIADNMISLQHCAALNIPILWFNSDSKEAVVSYYSNDVCATLKNRIFSGPESTYNIVSSSRASMSLVSVIKRTCCDVSESMIGSVFCSWKRKTWDVFWTKEEANKCFEHVLLCVLALTFRQNKQSISLC